MRDLRRDLSESSTVSLNDSGSLYDLIDSRSTLTTPALEIVKHISQTGNQTRRWLIILTRSSAAKIRSKFQRVRAMFFVPLGDVKSGERVGLCSGPCIELDVHMFTPRRAGRRWSYGQTARLSLIPEPCVLDSRPQKQTKTHHGAEPMITLVSGGYGSSA